MPSRSSCPAGIIILIHEDETGGVVAIVEGIEQPGRFPDELVAVL